ncbi:MAG: PorP/SprF family type IX secretion system membrane protein [Saprospiraceae bacterium]|nr:PorP/SprF family type IX secretion system membrane protein [Saprospiraceae bacterium]
MFDYDTSLAILLYSCIKIDKGESMKFAGMIFFLFLVQYVLSGQQRPQFTQYMLNKYAENPAYGGLERSLSVFTTYRDQFSTLAGNPRTFYLGADMPFYLWNGAIGFSVFNQKSGLFSNSNLKVSYNKVLGTPFGFLSFGGRIGVDLLNIDGLGIITPDGTYIGVYDHKDPFLQAAAFGGAGFSWELGSYFMGKSIQAGITLNELPSHTYSLGSGAYKRAFSMSVFGQYKLFLNEETEIIPSIMIRADGTVLQTDLGVIIRLNDNLFGGFNFRGYSQTSIDAGSIIIGTNLGAKYKVSYSYDFGLSALRTAYQGSHEIMLSYNLQKLIGIGLPPKIIYNPRDL